MVEKEVDIDFKLLEKYFTSGDIGYIVDLAYRNFYEEYGSMDITSCKLPKNGQLIELNDKKGNTYTATVPNNPNAKKAGVVYLMALCKLAGKDYDSMPTKSHKIFTTHDKKEILKQIDTHVEDLKLLEVSLGSQSIIRSMAHLRPKWMNLNSEEKDKYLGTILDMATEFALKGYDNNKIIREIRDNLEDITISRTALQNQLDEFGLDEGDMYHIILQNQNILIDRENETVTTQNKILLEKQEDINMEIDDMTAFENPQRTYNVKDETRVLQEGNKIRTEREVDIKYNE